MHPFTKSPELVTREADIVVSDVGVPNMVRGDWIKPGAVVVDMGMNQVQVNLCIAMLFLNLSLHS